MSPPIIGTVRAKLDGLEEPATAWRVREVVLAAYKEEHLRATNAMLAKYDLTLEEFKKKGREIFGDSIFSQCCASIEALSLNTSFLVAGYDEERETAHIFEVSELGKFDSHEVLGFAAIGSGASSALASLYFHSYNESVDLPGALYRVCDSKFMAESAAAVGKITSVLVMENDYDKKKISVSELSQNFLQEIRSSWEAKGRPQVPPDVVEQIDAGLKDRNKLLRIIF